MKVKFYDLGDNPFLTLFWGAVIFGVIWAISYWMEEKDIPILSALSSIIVNIARIGCIGCLISIPLNYFFGLL
jgi:hypothetical protein